ncbi:MAG: hypothetical protein ACRC5C_13815, partial [Bacilli bacterium]
MPKKKHTKVLANAALIALLLAPSAYVGPISTSVNAAVTTQSKTTKLTSIKQIHSDHVVLSTGTYKFSSKQMSAFFNNKKALEGAQLSVVTNEKNEIVAIQDLQLNKGGKRIANDVTRTKGNVVLHGQGLSILGNLTINRDYITVSNLNVKKDVHAQPTASTIVHLKNVSVQGRMILAKEITKVGTVSNLNRKAVSRLVRIENSTLNTITSSTIDTSIQAVGTSKVKLIEVDTFTIINASNSAVVGKVVASPRVRTLSVNGPINMVSVESAVITVWGKSNIKVIDAHAKGTVDVKVSGTVTQLNVHEEGTNVSIADRSMTNEIVAHAQMNITSAKPLPALTIAGNVEKFIVNDKVKNLTLKGKTTVALAQGAEVDLLVAEGNAEVNAENSVQKIREVNIAGNTTALKLNVATDVLNVTTDTKDKV